MPKIKVYVFSPLDPLFSQPKYKSEQAEHTANTVNSESGVLVTEGKCPQKEEIINIRLLPF